MNFGDTIVAISSAVGPAARMIVRLSGPHARATAKTVCELSDEHASARQLTLRLNDLSVRAWVYQFHSPQSYTAEDIVEFHLPGNVLLVRLLMDELIRRGARLAEAGEFTARAYFAGRMNLTEAEGVAATIAANGEQELAAAQQLMAGELTRRIQPVIEQVVTVLALVEAAIDFSEEDISFIARADLIQKIAMIAQDLESLLAESARFERIEHQPEFVLVGRPNAGKSTLLNSLATSERALVSPIAGTTRDVISAEIALKRGMVRLIDAAGLEEVGEATAGAAEQEIALKMQSRAMAALNSADFVVWVQDITDSRTQLNLPRRPHLMLWTKSDLMPGYSLPNNEGIIVSALNGTNLKTLRERMDELAFGDQSAETPKLALNSRHLASIRDGIAAMNSAKEAVDRAQPEVVALGLREAIDALGSIAGQVTPDDVLGRVFSQFCVGK